MQCGRELGLDGDDAARDGGSDPGDEPTTAHRDDNRVDVRQVFLDLEANVTRRHRRGSGSGPAQPISCLPVSLLQATASR